jgi:ribosomal protein S18 acetylase RimI-like enzyme
MYSHPSPNAFRLATAGDLEPIVNTVCAALAEDPVSRWIFPKPDQLRAWWFHSVSNALPHDWVWIADSCTAVAVWAPPDWEESAEPRNKYLPLLRELIGDRVAEVTPVLERYAEARPADKPHYYMTFLGTASIARGRGLARSLLAHNLARIDDERMPACLAVSNDAAQRLYLQAGFSTIDSFSVLNGHLRVTTMWRDAKKVALA